MDVLLYKDHFTYIKTHKEVFTRINTEKEKQRHRKSTKYTKIQIRGHVITHTKKNSREFKNILLSSVVTASGLILILLIQYLSLLFTGTVFWKEGWLYVNLLFGIVPIMIILPIYHRYFFNLTGSVYLGPITMVLIFIMILLSNTVCYFPL